MQLALRNKREQALGEYCWSMRATVERIHKRDLNAFRDEWRELWEREFDWDAELIADTDPGYYHVDLMGFTPPQYAGETAAQARKWLEEEYGEQMDAEGWV